MKIRGLYVISQKRIGCHMIPTHKNTIYLIKKPQKPFVKKPSIYLNKET